MQCLRLHLNLSSHTHIYTAQHSRRQLALAATAATSKISASHTRVARTTHTHTLHKPTLCTDVCACVCLRCAVCVVGESEKFEI